MSVAPSTREAANPGLARKEFILGGQKSGKSRRAEELARDWLAADAGHRACLVATGQAWDDEMRMRIARHQRDRALRVPRLVSLEEPLRVAETIAAYSRPDTLLVVDCLTVWLTNWLMPHPDAGQVAAQTLRRRKGEGEHAGGPGDGDIVSLVIDPLLRAIADAPGPLAIVGHEIGLGVIPMGRETRDFVDVLGKLNQQVAGVCQRVTLMVAGLPLPVKEV